MVGRNPLSGPGLLLSLLLGAVGTAALAYVSGTTRVLTTQPLFERAEPIATGLWFTPAGHLAASWVEGKTVRVTITAPDGEVTGVREAPVPPENYSLSPDAAWIFWRDSRRLHWQSLATGQPTELAAPVTKPIRAHVLLDDGAAVLLLADGAVEIRAPGATSAARHETELDRAVKLAVSGPYLALASASQWIVYRILSHDDWRLVERGAVPGGIRMFAVSPSGRIAAESSDGWHSPSAILPVPGKTSAAVFGFDGDLFVTGDFAGVLRLRPNERPLAILSAPENTFALAANDYHVALSGPTGVRAARFFVDTLITPTGRILIYAAAGFFSLIFVLPAAGWILQRVRWRKQVQSVRRGDETLDQGFPPELIQAILSHQCVVYGGDHLGALAGFPTWAEFAPYVIEWAANENLITPAVASTLRDKAAKNPHAAIDDLVLDAITFRERLAAFYREVYLSELHPSTAHLALYEMPFCGAISSGVDRGFDPLAKRHSAESFAPGQTGYAKLVRNGQFFSLHLRGDLTDPEMASLSRAEAKKRLAESDEFTQAMQFLAQTRTFLFIGLTLDDLEAEIGHLRLPIHRARHHYAFVATRDLGSRERRISVRLAEEYGIEVFPYPADRGADVLSPLLASVAARFTEKVKRWAPGSER